MRAEKTVQKKRNWNTQKPLSALITFVVAVGTLSLNTVTVAHAAPANDFQVYPVTIGENNLGAQRDTTPRTISCPSWDTTKAPAIPGRTFKYAVYTEKAASNPLDPNFFGKAELSGENLKIQGIKCLDDGSYEVVPATSHSTPEQSNIQLTASRAELASHLHLVYFDDSKTLEIPVRINSQTGTNVSGVSYDEPNKRAIFTYNSKTGAYETQLTVDTPRDQTITITNGTGANVGTVVSDDSDDWRTTRTYTVKATRADQTGGITINTQQFNRVKLYVPTFTPAGGDGGYPTHGRVRYLSIINPGNPERTWRHTCEFNPTGNNDCQTNDYDTSKATLSPYTAGYTLGAPTTSFGADETVGRRGTVTWWLDMLPDQYPDPGGNAFPGDAFSSFMASLEINGQEIALPFPHPCMHPAQVRTGQLKPVASWDKQYGYTKEFCFEDTWYWGYYNQSWWKKYYYACVRSWIQGNENVKANEEGCGYAKSGSWEKTLPPREIYSKRIESGANAGATVTVTILNTRHAGDSEPLKNLVGYSGINDGMQNNQQTTTRWRIRYAITVSDIRTEELHINANFDWNTHNYVLLSGGSGVQATDPATRGSMQTWGYTDQERAAAEREGKTPTPHWLTQCANPFTGGDDSGDTASPCSYAWHELMPGDGSDRPQYRVKAKNGYGTPSITADGYTASGYNAADDYYYFTTARAKKWDQGMGYGNNRLFNNTPFPVFISAHALDYTVNYYTTDGKLITDVPGIVNGTVVNAARNYSFGVASTQPDVGSNIFNGWDIEGWNNGQRVGAIAHSVDPGANIDIRGMRFIDGEKAGERALTTGGGERQITELRLIPNTSTVAEGQAPGFYPADRIIGRDSGEAKDTLFYYRAVPGLKANFTAKYLDDHSEVTETPAGGESITYPLVPENSTLGKITVSTNPQDPKLLLYYGIIAKHGEVALLTYNSDARENVSNSAYNYSFLPLDAEAAAASEGWHANATRDADKREITAEQGYKFVANVPAGAEFVRLEKYTGDLATYDDESSAINPTLWTEVNPEEVVFAANKLTILRAVVRLKSEHMLPLTGGWARDYYLLIGGGVVILGLLTASWLKYRSRKLG